MRQLFGLGPTGRFPNGKLTKHDGGELMIGVYIDHGTIIINLGVRTDWIGLGPAEARAMAAQLIKRADILEGKAKET